MKTTEQEPRPAAPILSDPLYRECIRLAQLSRGESQRYGARCVKDGVVIGSGYSRAIVHFSFGKLERIIRQGIRNHAEIEALNDALMNGSDVTGSELFVAGYFPKLHGLLNLKREYTCILCPPILKKYGVSRIYVPAPQGWIPKTIDQALAEGRKYKSSVKGETENRRIAAVMGNWTLSDLEL